MPGTPSLRALPAIAEVLTISRTRLPASNLLILRSPDRMISLKPKSDISPLKAFSGPQCQSTQCKLAMASQALGASLSPVP